ncbi:MAG TPA: lysylphosphatidylglycerol synthase domain-containing protein [Acidimicrobiales bacterium]|nr:lysylphosphatidylglycerol synthase domain-containing protein [Acidimicrobiales bacterium]
MSVGRWRERSFGPASEEPYRRRTSDWVRVGVAAAVLTLLASHVGVAGEAQRALFHFFNSLPGGLKSLFRAIYTVGAIWAVGIVVVAALVARRWRLARDLLISGILAWVVARVIGVFVVQHKSFGDGLDIVTRIGHSTPSFPHVRVAVVVAILSAASPYLTRPSRRIGQVLVFGLMMAAVYLGTAYPNDLLAGLFLGWGLAALVHLAFGSPGGRPTTIQVSESLAQLGVPATEIHLAPRQPEGASLFLAEDAAGPLWVKVVGRDEADAQLLAKAWRFLAYKDSGPTLFLTRLQQVEHEAYTVLLAQNAGARVPEVVVAGTAGPGAALLVERPVPGSRLLDLEPASVTDELLVHLWTQVARLHSRPLAHGRLNANHVVVAEGGPAIVDFGTASSSADPEDRSRDVAELLASTAALVEVPRAMAAAIRGAGPQAMAQALPMLQSPALSREVRPWHPLRRRDLRERLNALREAGAQATGTEAPELEELHRIRSSSLLMALGSLVAVGALLSQVGSPAQIWNTLQHAQWVWVVVAFALAVGNNLAYAVAYMGTIAMRLPFWRTAEMQTAVRFSNLAVPGVGGAAVQIRYLQKQGADIASAVTAGGFLSGFSAIVVQLGIFALALALAPNSINLGKIDTSNAAELLLIVVLVVSAGVGVVFGVPRIRRTVLPPLHQAASTLWAAMRSPRQLLLLLGGNAVATFVTSFVLLTCLEAYGAHLSVWTLLVVNIAVGTIASLVPIPGGPTAVGAIGISGALVTLGVANEKAVAAVLTYQVVNTFLPAVPGWFATRDMIDHDYL